MAQHQNVILDLIYVWYYVSCHFNQLLLFEVSIKKDNIASPIAYNYAVIDLKHA